MINVNTLSATYVAFNNVRELEQILKVFKRFNFSYKNGTHEDAMSKANHSVVNKVICHDKFVMTSKEKVTTISFKAFLALSANLSSNEALINNDNKNTMATMTNNSSNPRAIINELRGSKLFKDEKYLEGLADKAESVEALVNNFVATLDKAEDKADRAAELLNAYCAAIGSKDIAEIERLDKLIDSSITFITKTNKILGAINTTGGEIIKAAKKDDKDTGAKFIGE